MWMKALGRGQRRRFGRAAAGMGASAAGIALMALLAGPMAPPVHAATINIDATCSLVDAIRSANTDTSVGTCEAGSGADTIVLSGDVTLTSSYVTLDNTPTGLPEITSTITIESAAGSHFTIARDDSAGQFRLMAVGATGDLTVRNVTLSNGHAQQDCGYSCDDEGTGGAIYNLDGAVTLDSVILSGNKARRSGGAIRLEQSNGSPQQAKLSITNSVITDSYVVGGWGGGIDANGGVFTITHSVVSYNSVGGDGAGINLDCESSYISHVTIDNNDASGEGGGIFVNSGTHLIVNSTFSGNSASDGGAIAAFGGTLNVEFTTITDNYVDSEGGGIYSYYYADVTVRSSIISGNRDSSLGDNEIDEDDGDISVYNSILGHAGENYDQAFSSVTLDGSNFIATSDRENVALDAILETTAADNGGPELPGDFVMLTHNLIEGSPAIDFIAEPCEVDDDQVGTARPDGEACNAGSMEAVVPGGEDAVPGAFVSVAAAGKIGRQLSFGANDILRYDGTTWTKWFDAEAAGLTTPKQARFNVDSLWVSDADAGAAVMSFLQSGIVIPGITGKVDGTDLLLWDGSAFSVWFEGEDVGLDNESKERVDGLHVMSKAPAWSEFSGDTCEAYLLISTFSQGVVPKPGNPKPVDKLVFGGEDILGFCATSLGTAAAGEWELVFDGSEYNVKSNDLNSISASADGQTLYLVSRDAFTFGTTVVKPFSVFSFDVATKTFSGPVFSPGGAGMSRRAKIDGLNLMETAPVPVR